MKRGGPYLALLASFVLILKFVDPFIGDWDGLDYTILSLRGYPSSMALGRGLFIFFVHSFAAARTWDERTVDAPTGWHSAGRAFAGRR